MDTISLKEGAKQKIFKQLKNKTMTTDQLVQKILKLQPSEIIMAMVNGLKKRHTKIDMASYGFVDIEPKFLGLFKKKVCYGCAATNTIMELNGKCDVSILRGHRNTNLILSDFEAMINYLRIGNINLANTVLDNLNLRGIKAPVDLILPLLEDDYTLAQLEPYIKLAKYNKEIEDSKNW